MERFENKSEQHKFEENPFEDETVSQEWINSVENESGLIRDKEIYPRLNDWVQETNPEVLLEIGAGQGICSDKIPEFGGKYVGIEPSKKLVERAMELYKSDQRDFIVGNAYDLPMQSESCDASFAINVWFHLENLQKASSEMARVLKRNGNFLIITVNPKDYKNWLGGYENKFEDDKKVIGKANTPVNPLSKNIFYKHSLEKIESSLKEAGLQIDSVENFGWGDREVFLVFKGHKK